MDPSDETAVPLSGVAPGLGSARGGLFGCAVGGLVGYFAGETISAYGYEWSADTVFRPLPRTAR